LEAFPLDSDLAAIIMFGVLQRAQNKVFFFYGPSRELVAGQVIIAVSVIANLASRFITCLAESTIQVEISENETMILWREVPSKTIVLCTFSEGEFFSIQGKRYVVQARRPDFSI
jgi:hypothetical protein